LSKKRIKNGLTAGETALCGAELPLNGSAPTRLREDVDKWKIVHTNAQTQKIEYGNAITANVKYNSLMRDTN
jgi:hypothetical protein